VSCHHLGARRYIRRHIQFLSICVLRGYQESISPTKAETYKFFDVTAFPSM
jgi:hypothetical protein